MDPIEIYTPPNPPNKVFEVHDSPVGPYAYIVVTLDKEEQESPYVEDILDCHLKNARLAMLYMINGEEGEANKSETQTDTS